MENCTGFKPLLEDVDSAAADPLAALADKYFHLPCSVMTRNDRRLESLRELARIYRPECVIDLIWQACLTYDVESHRVKRFVEEELRTALSADRDRLLPLRLCANRRARGGAFRNDSRRMIRGCLLQPVHSAGVDCRASHAPAGCPGLLGAAAGDICSPWRVQLRRAADRPPAGEEAVRYSSSC